MPKKKLSVHPLIELYGGPARFKRFSEEQPGQFQAIVKTWNSALALARARMTSMYHKALSAHPTENVGLNQFFEGFHDKIEVLRYPASHPEFTPPNNDDQEERRRAAEEMRRAETEERPHLRRPREEVLRPRRGSIED